MTRGAAPLPPSPERHLLDTPTRKRKRLEIAASDASSSNEPISPHKYPNSTPRRFAKRLCTPVSESRRRSAPTDYQRSPLKPLDPNKMRALDNLPSVNLKQEKIVGLQYSQAYLYLTMTEFRTGMGSCWAPWPSFKIPWRLVRCG